jgi:hypothetical protein
MEATILLNSNENTRQVEHEERENFIRSVLGEMGLPLEDVYEDDGSLSLDGKVRLRSLLGQYGVQVIDNRDGEVKIYADRELVAIWNKPKYSLRKDLLELDPTKKLFLEMRINSWSVFEETTSE